MGKEDLELTEFHRYLTGIRNRTSVFRRGAFKPLLAENGMIAYGRFDADEQGVVVVNSEDYAQRVRIPVWEAEVTADVMVRVMAPRSGTALQCRKPVTTRWWRECDGSGASGKWSDDLYRAEFWAG